MSYNTDLQTNNTSLQEILATVNALPEAGGSSGGGAEIETCDVRLMFVEGEMVYYLALENGNLVIKSSSERFTTLTNVVVNSFLIYCTSYAPSSSEHLMMTTPTYSYNFNNSSCSVYIFQIPSGGITISTSVS